MKMTRAQKTFEKLQHVHWNPESYVYPQGYASPKQSPKECSPLADLRPCKEENKKLKQTCQWLTVV